MKESKLKLVIEEVGKSDYLYYGFERGGLSVGIGTTKNNLENAINIKTWLRDLAGVVGAEFINKTNYSI